MKKTIALCASILVLTLLLVSCNSKSDPADAVLNYLNALVSQDSDAAVALSCAEWEEQAKLETDSFLSVKAALNAVQCQTLASDNSEAEVACSGTIDLTYNEEVRSIDLSVHTYALQYQAGEWLVCGYK